jgi:RNA polymerase sigma-70 factor (ECF subfamily)
MEMEKATGKGIARAMVLHYTIRAYPMEPDATVSRARQGPATVRALPVAMPEVPEELIQRCAREEAKAQYELYRLLFNTLMGICTRYERNRDDAVAALNKGFLKILVNLGRRPAAAPFVPWVKRIMINSVIDDFRRNRRRRELERSLEDMDDASWHTVNDYLERMDVEEIEEMVQRLPPMQRVVFNLFAMDGFDHASIARQLGISEGTSKAHLSIARGKLRTMITERKGSTAS